MNFESFAEQHGLIIDHVVHDRWTRVPTTDKPHSKNGAYIWDGQAGAVQNWALHEKPLTFRDKKALRTIDPDWYKKKEKLEKDRELRRVAAAKKAAWIMNNAVKRTHPYLVKKGFITDCPNQWVWNDLLVIPMRIDQKLVGVQLIDCDGNKKFLSGQITKGAEAIIDAKGRHILCEGYATAMSIRRALKNVGKRYTIHVCFSASNLLEISQRYPECMIVADHDPVGIRTAKKTGKPFWISPLDGEDFNDYEFRVGATEAGNSLIAIGQSVASS
jgi:putative DNA primase/helicase